MVLAQFVSRSRIQRGCNKSLKAKSLAHGRSGGVLSVALPVRRRDGSTRVAAAVSSAAADIQRLLLPVDDGLPTESCLVTSVSKFLNDVNAGIRGERADQGDQSILGASIVRLHYLVEAFTCGVNIVLNHGADEMTGSDAGGDEGDQSSRLGRSKSKATKNDASGSL